MFPNIDKLIYCIKERQSIYLKKEAGEPQPWTVDPILSTYRFCNVYREQDTVTKWISKNYSNDFDDHNDLWFAIVVARLFNLPSTLSAIKPFLFFDQEFMKRTLKEIKNSGQNVFNAAYIVSTNGVSMDKIEYLADRVLAPMWELRAYYRPTGKDTLESFFNRLNTANGMGKFMSAQVVADMKDAKPLMFAEDWWSFAEPGPGSLRGMRRVLGLDVKDTKQDKHWKKNLDILREMVNNEIAGAQPQLHAQNLQNDLCEFDKFMRALTGEGKPKQQYRRAK